MKSWKSKKYQILRDFQKRAFYRLVYLHEILSIFIKSPDFSEITDIPEIKEISDFNQFSKESLLPFGVCNEQISSDNLQ